MRFERWRPGAPPQARPYNTVQDTRFHHTEYEDPDYYYSCTPESVQTKTMDFPPPLPPLPPQATLGSGRVLVSNGGKSSATSTLTPKDKHGRRNTKVYLFGACFTAVSLLLAVTILGFFVLRPPQSLFGTQTRSTARPSPLILDTEEGRTYTHLPSQTVSQPPRPVDRVIEANNLLTLMITKRKLCIFEASSDRIEYSRQLFREEHIEGARLLFFTNLSHSGVPVHPLQFQRYVRNLGVDGDCHVVLYDRGQQIWASYAYWIFTLFGHKKVSLLNGGLDEWKRHRLSSAQYRIETGPGGYVQRLGTFQSEWRSDVILTFDDVIANADTKIFDVVDAQAPEEYGGQTSGAINGHIRSAVNIPVDGVYDFNENHWKNSTQLSELFESRGLNPSKPVIVYCSTSTRATAVWWALMKQNYRAAIYFGSWPEWLIRAPDYLKMIPDKQAPIFVNITDIQS
ncbi:hypothetical protein QR680_007250 [Steinernema hermaphroditum]|uniref:Rhodanese domain-containing protein n=1 Tax=Steinernema hermaphroditum TaxID=289476 RepID=A0AA39LYI0_9BILA|nr:hypothetical protein QR680_007250 [Steinernema hermaphroditum]